MLNKRAEKEASKTKRGWDKPVSLEASLWWLSRPERFPWEGRKQVWRQSQDLQRTKNLNQDEMANTMRELWHKLWGEWGLSRQEAKHMHWHRYRQPQANRGSLPTRRMNSVTSLSHSSVLSFSPLFCFRLLHRVEWASAFSGASQYFILLPPTLPLHFRNGCGNTSTQTASSLPRRAGGCLQNNTLKFYWHKKLTKFLSSLT